LILILGAVGLFGLALCHEVLLVWPVQELRGWLLARKGPAARAPLEAISAGGPRAARLESGDWDDPISLPEPPTSGEIRVHPPIPVVGVVASTPASGTAPAIVGSRIAPSSSREIAPLAPGHHGTLFQLPPKDLLEPPADFPVQEHEAKIHSRAMLLERTLLDFGYQVRVTQIDTGPVITQFEIELEAGLRVSRIMSLADDLAIALAVPSVRIVAPIPGKTTVGIEVPNDHRNMVRLGEVITGVDGRYQQCRIPLFLGKDAKGQPLVFDLAEMPHLLMAGRTGTGKSVCLNAMILSILMTRRPDEVKMILIDPKKVELSQYKKIPHLMHPVVTDMKKAESILAWACEKMDERYEFLRRAEVRNIQAFNKLGAEEIYARVRPEEGEDRTRTPTYMPHIVIIADELAEMMMTAEKEVEQHIVRLAQLARAVGVHLIVATQKPTVDVVTGLIKGNLPARIAFQVTSRSDSRVVLDEIGADRLLGNGDLLFLIPGTSHIIRAQGTYVSDLEVDRVCRYLERYPVEFSRELLQLQVSGGPGGKDRGAALKERDELYEPAIEIVIREGRGSCSLLQRALGIGYGRAARLIDFMAEDGIVGEFKSGSAREVLYTWDEWEALKNGGAPKDEAAA
jgi:S-DNA-T family DNA segregation ATPase FtsK/SpoIIIE